MARVYRITRGLSLGSTLDEIQRYLNDLSKRAGMDPMIVAAEREVLNSYGDTVSVEEKKKSLLKFGLNDNVGTSRTTIMQFQGSETNETYCTTNAIDRVVTTDNTFTGTVTIEGHYIDGSNNLIFAVQTATLTGQTAVTLGTALARATRIYISDGSALASASDVIYVYENVTTTAGVPDTASKTHVLMDGTYHGSQKASTSISSTDYWFITKAYAGVNKKASAAVDVEVQVRTYTDAAFRTLFKLPLDTNGASYFQIDAPPIFIIPKNSDVRMVAASSTSGTEVIGGLAGYLAKII